ncbi:diguanylate cyclase [Vibrio lentus]|nr:diguanylate cyclase [Vibrio lentus]
MRNSTNARMTKINPRHGHIYQQAVNQSHPDCSFAQYIVKSFTTSAFRQENYLSNSIAIPTELRVAKSAGVLFSTFTSPLSPDQQQEVIKHHQLFADIVIHTLREMWFNDRSEHSQSTQLAKSHTIVYRVAQPQLFVGYVRVHYSTECHPFHGSSVGYKQLQSFINDMHGNYISDKVLQHVAETLRRTLPENNLTFRTAGNEFAFITYHNDSNRYLRTDSNQNKTRLLQH